jgi:hypothetical protein
LFSGWYFPGKMAKPGRPNLLDLFFVDFVDIGCPFPGPARKNGKHLQSREKALQVLFTSWE